MCLTTVQVVLRQSGRKLHATGGRSRDLDWCHDAAIGFCQLAYEQSADKRVAAANCYFQYFVERSAPDRTGREVLRAVSSAQLCEGERATTISVRRIDRKR